MAVVIFSWCLLIALSLSFALSIRVLAVSISFMFLAAVAFDRCTVYFLLQYVCQDWLHQQLGILPFFIFPLFFSFLFFLSLLFVFLHSSPSLWCLLFFLLLSSKLCSCYSSSLFLVLYVLYVSCIELCISGDTITLSAPLLSQTNSFDNLSVMTVPLLGYPLPL